MHPVLHGFFPKHAHIFNCKLCLDVSEADWLVAATSGQVEEFRQES